MIKITMGLKCTRDIGKGRSMRGRGEVDRIGSVKRIKAHDFSMYGDNIKKPIKYCFLKEGMKGGD
jgi:hypothetical protein